VFVESKKLREELKKTLFGETARVLVAIYIVRQQPSSSSSTTTAGLGGNPQDNYKLRSGVPRVTSSRNIYSAREILCISTDGILSRA
jgi:hypothetical protein